MLIILRIDLTQYMFFYDIEQFWFVLQYKIIQSIEIEDVQLCM